jgi:hypothetical protein
MSRLYEEFHGAKPVRQRKIKINLPKRMWKLGRATRINYMPERPSKHAGTEFTHEFGDYGSFFDDRNLPLVAVSEDGNMIVLIKDKSKYRVTKRGIIG